MQRISTIQKFHSMEQLNIPLLTMAKQLLSITRLSPLKTKKWYVVIYIIYNIKIEINYILKNIIKNIIKN